MLIEGFNISIDNRLIFMDTEACQEYFLHMHARTIAKLAYIEPLQTS